MGLNVADLPVVTMDLVPSLPGPRLAIFLSRCKFNNLTAPQPIVQVYLLTHVLTLSATDARIKTLFSKNRTHDFRTLACVQVTY